MIELMMLYEELVPLSVEEVEVPPKMRYPLEPTPKVLPILKVVNPNGKSNGKVMVPHALSLDIISDIAAVVTVDGEV